MARPCTICESPDRASIEIGLANGIALRVLGLRHSVSEDALGRHRAKHMPGDLLGRLRMRSSRSEEELAQIRDVETKSLLDNFTLQRQILYRNADMSFAIKDLAGERAAISEAGKVTERIAKLVGELGVANLTVNHQINLIQSPMWHQIRTALVRELRPLGAQAIAACGRAIEAAEAAINVPTEPVLPAIEAL